MLKKSLSFSIAFSIFFSYHDIHSGFFDLMRIGIVGGFKISTLPVQILATGLETAAAIAAGDYDNPPPNNQAESNPLPAAPSLPVAPTVQVTPVIQQPFIQQPTTEVITQTQAQAQAVINVQPLPSQLAQVVTAVNIPAIVQAAQNRTLSVTQPGHELMHAAKMCDEVPPMPMPKETQTNASPVTIVITGVSEHITAQHTATAQAQAPVNTVLPQAAPPTPPHPMLLQDQNNPLCNNWASNPQPIYPSSTFLSTAHQSLIEKIKTWGNRSIEYIKRNKIRTILYGTVGCYTAMQSYLWYLSWSLKSTHSWSQWKKHLSIAELEAMDSTVLAKEIMQAIEKYGKTVQPLQNTLKKAHFVKECNHELTLLKRYRRLISLLEITLLKKFFFYDEFLLKEVIDRTARLEILKNAINSHNADEVIA